MSQGLKWTGGTYTYGFIFSKIFRLCWCLSQHSFIVAVFLTRQNTTSFALSPAMSENHNPCSKLFWNLQVQNTSKLPLRSNDGTGGGGGAVGASHMLARSSPGACPRHSRAIASSGGSLWSGEILHGTATKKGAHARLCLGNLKIQGLRKLRVQSMDIINT